MNRLLPTICVLLWLIPGLLTAQELTFAKQQTQVGDTSQQTIECRLDAERSIRQQTQVVDSSKQQLVRKQNRTLTILEIQDGRPTRAQIKYGESQTRVKAATQEAIEATHPVAEHTYFVQKRAGEELLITNPDGSQPTPEELEILQLHLETFGKANPLATFLHNKRVRVGQSIVVPDEVARELLGLTGKKGNADKLSLKLVNIRNLDAKPHAIFETLLRTSNRKANSMSLLMKGQLVIDSTSCRTRAISLEGPVAISETKGPTAGQFVVSTNGTLNVRVVTTYGTGRIAQRAAATSLR